MRTRFSVVVDYALTPDALEALYKTYYDQKKICVFGSAGGGRDKWKRPVMGAIADERCDEVILTNEDPYDEDPLSIIADIARDMKKRPDILADRRAAIRRGIELAEQSPSPEQTIVLITGKGTDPCICVANGEKIPWSDAQVAREELEKMLAAKHSPTGRQV